MYEIAADTCILQSRVLRHARIVREEFDPHNDAHLISLQTFLATGNWGKVQFYAEPPYTTVPETVFRKVAQAYISMK